MEENNYEMNENNPKADEGPSPDGDAVQAESSKTTDAAPQIPPAQQNAETMQAMPGGQDTAAQQGMPGYQNMRDQQAGTGYQNHMDQQGMPGYQNMGDQQAGTGYQNYMDQQGMPGYQNTGGSQGIPGYLNAEQQPKKKGPIVAIVLLCVFIILLIICGVILGIGMLSSPKEKVMKAVGTTMADVDTTFADYLGMQDLMTLTTKDKYSSELELTLEELEDNYWGDDYSMLSGIGIKTEINMDYKARKMLSDMKIRYNGANIVGLKMVADDTQLGIEMPDFYDGYLVMNYENFAENYNNSYISRASGLTVDEDYKVDMFSGGAATGGEVFKKKYAEDLKNIYEVIEVSKTDEKRDVELNGKTQSCTGYEVVIPQVAIQVFIEDILEFTESISTYEDVDYSEIEEMMLELFDEDIEAMVYLDKKGRMVAFECRMELGIEDEAIDYKLDVEWTGKEHLCNAYVAKMSLKDKETEETIKVTVKHSLTKEGSEVRRKLTVDASGDGLDDYEAPSFEYKSSIDTSSGESRVVCVMDADGEELWNLDVRGAFQNVKAGKQFKYDMDSLVLSMEDSDYVVRMSGSYALGDLKKEIVVDIDNSRDLLEMKEMDYYELVEEIADNLYNSPIMNMLMY